MFLLFTEPETLLSWDDRMIKKLLRFILDEDNPYDGEKKKNEADTRKAVFTDV